MRLDAAEIRAIRAATVHAFGPEAVVRLFGSRADDARRGGDIDLHIEAPSDIDPRTARSRFEANLFARIEAQRVDVIVCRRGDPDRGIDLVARRDGIPL